MIFPVWIFPVLDLSNDHHLPTYEYLFILEDIWIGTQVPVDVRMIENNINGLFNGENSSLLCNVVGSYKIDVIAIPLAT